MMKILVVDDEKLVVKGIKFNLEHDGYEVVTAFDGESAVALTSLEKPDLVILDLMMPKLDGLEACMQIRAFSNVPIIMLTARSTDMDKLMGFECGADDYVTKPFNPRELAARVRSQLRRYTCWGTSTRRSGRASSSTGASPTTRTAGNCGRMGKR